jgi:hypothetical protein
MYENRINKSIKTVKSEEEKGDNVGIEVVNIIKINYMYACKYDKEPNLEK